MTENETTETDQAPDSAPTQTSAAASAAASTSRGFATRTKVVLAAVVAVVAVGALIAFKLAVTESGTASLTEAEARTAFAEIEKSVTTNGPHDLCEKWADDEMKCQQSLAETSDLGAPAKGAEVVGVDAESRSVVLTVTGDLMGPGEDFSTDVEFLVDSDGKVRAVDPVYWSSHQIDRAA